MPWKGERKGGEEMGKGKEREWGSREKNSILVIVILRVADKTDTARKEGWTKWREPASESMWLWKWEWLSHRLASACASRLCQRQSGQSEAIGSSLPEPPWWRLLETASKDSSEDFINLTHCYKFQLTKFFNLNVIIIYPNSIDPSGLNRNAPDEQDLFIIRQKHVLHESNGQQLSGL